jgi:hypothetical protein
MPKLKLSDNGQPVYQDGKFVLVGDDGAETAFDPLSTHATFGTIRGERDKFKGEAETALAELTAFGKSPDERKAAIEKLKMAANLDAKKLVDAGKIEELVAERLRAAQEEWAGKEKALSGKSQELEGLLDEILIEKAFAGSKVLDEYFPTWSLLQHEFRGRLAREGKSLVGFRDAERKERIYSSTNPGQLAQGDELLAALLKSHPDHDKWKKGANANGPGSPGSPGGGGNGAKTASRQQWEAMSPADQTKFALDGGQITN